MPRMEDTKRTTNAGKSPLKHPKTLHLEYASPSLLVGRGPECVRPRRETSAASRGQPSDPDLRGAVRGVRQRTAAEDRRSHRRMGRGELDRDESFSGGTRRAVSGTIRFRRPQDPRPPASAILVDTP